MQISVRSHLVYKTTQPCNLLLQIEALSDDVQSCRQTRLMFDRDAVHKEIVGEEGLGTRRWISAGPLFECTYETVAVISRAPVALDGLTQTPWMDIPAEVVKYLMPSRYCHSDLFLDFVSSEFAGLQGGAMIRAMRDWISSNFTYDSGASFPATTASDSFASQSGVCRDYAHVLIAFARAAGIPARFASVYGPDVDPQDFHAVAEVFLDGSWHLVDATGMATPEEMVRICVGRDAADASFLTAYGGIELVEQSVEVRRVNS